MSMGGMSEILPLTLRRNAALAAAFRAFSLPFVKRARVTLKGCAP